MIKSLRISSKLKRWEREDVLTLFISITISFFFRLMDEYAFYCFVFIVLVLIYLILKPMILWLVTINSIDLLTYLFTSLCALIFYYHFQIEGDKAAYLYDPVKVIFQCLAYLGILLILIQLIKGKMKN